MAFRVLGPIEDPDTFWHIASGDLIRSKFELVVSPDPWSATATRPWILNQWLSELAMSWAHGVAGLAGVAWLQTLAAVVLIIILWWVCRTRSTGLVASVVVAMAFFAMSASISPRPQMVTFLLAAISTHAWLRTADDGRARWWLVPITWVWACSHGMWFLGPVIGLAVVVGLALDRRLRPGALGRLVSIPIVSVLAAGLTPVGPILLTSPFQVGEVTSYITEWQPTELGDPRTIALLLLVAIPVLLAMHSQLRATWVNTLLLGLAFALGLLQARGVALGAAVAAPMAAGALHRLTRLPMRGVGRVEIITTFVTAVVALAVAALVAPSVAGTPARGPSGLDPSLDALPRRTIICNDMILGGWLIWRHPDLRVTLDGRMELYSTGFIEDYRVATNGMPGWQRYIDSSRCGYALFESGSYLATTLAANGWSPADSADGYVLLRAPS